MANYCIGGVSFDTIDYGVATSTPKKSYSSYQTFEKRAAEELASLDAEDYKHTFLALYSENGYLCHTGNPQTVLRLSTTGQDYLYSGTVQKMRYCNALAVYQRKGDKCHLLWKVERLQPNVRPMFLNPKKLEKALKKVFSNIKIKLGELRCNSVPCIAWQVSANEGTFYIPWHSGVLVEEDSSQLFAEKTFEAVRQTYKIMRFALDDGNCYRVTRA